MHPNPTHVAVPPYLPFTLEVLHKKKLMKNKNEMKNKQKEKETENVKHFAPPSSAPLHDFFIHPFATGSFICKCSLINKLLVRFTAFGFGT